MVNRQLGIVCFPSRNNSPRVIYRGTSGARVCITVIEYLRLMRARARIVVAARQLVRLLLLLLRAAEYAPPTTTTTTDALIISPSSLLMLLGGCELCTHVALMDSFRKFNFQNSKIQISLRGLFYNNARLSMETSNSKSTRRSRFICIS